MVTTMTMTISLHDVTQIDSHVWRASIDRPETSIFKRASSHRIGQLTVILVHSPPKFDATANTLSFAPASATLLNQGFADQAIIIHSPSFSLHAPPGERDKSSDGDERFLHFLRNDLTTIGTSLLRGVRKFFPQGTLVFHPKSGKYVESPHLCNFWTVRIQPRDKSLRITVYGTPESFQLGDSSTVNLKKDMNSYSVFKVAHERQILDAIAIIKQAHQKKCGDKST